MKLCIHCKKEIQNEAMKCRYCGKRQTKENAADIFDRIHSSSQIHLGGGIGKSMGLFMAANAGVMIMLMIVARIFDPHADIDRDSALADRVRRSFCNAVSFQVIGEIPVQNSDSR